MDALMDEEFAVLVEIMGPMKLDDPALMREQFALLEVETVTSPSASFRDVEVAGPDGGALTLRVYEPHHREGPAPGIAYFHGGAFVLGDLEIEHLKCLRHAEAGTVVVSVDYRLAPEHRYPAGVEDCYAGLTWLADHAADLGVDGDRLAVGGSSAGGALAAAAAMMARDRGGPALGFQLLIYPVTDDRLATGSMARFDALDGWNGAASRQMWDHYLGPGRAAAPPYAAPARATDLSGLPPAYVSAAEFDPLRDEGIAYAVALMAAGVRTELHVFPGVPHGFDIFLPDAGVSRQAIDEQVRAVRSGLGV